jgi:hypothetical protein
MPELYQALFNATYFNTQVKASTDINPSLTNAVDAVKAWIAGSKLGQLKYKSVFETDYNNYIPVDYGKFKALNEDQLKRRKYHFRANASYAYLCKSYDELLVLTLYLDVFVPNDIIKDEILYMLSFCDYMDIDRLKDLSGLYKKYQKLVSVNWIYMIDLANLRDFQPSPDPEDIYNAVEEWVTRKA